MLNPTRKISVALNAGVGLVQGGGTGPQALDLRPTQDDAALEFLEDLVFMRRLLVANAGGLLVALLCHKLL
jgi:hypothetical protein